MRLISGLCLCGILMTSSGCLPVLVGGLFYQDAKKREARENFMREFRAANIEREKAGLAPLDLCSEKYQFDRGWAMRDPLCRERIRRYEAGEVTALAIQDDSLAARTRLELDARIVSVATAAVVAAASQHADDVPGLRAAVDGCAAALLATRSFDGSIAVIPFGESGFDADAGYGEAASSMMMSALRNGSQLRLVERLELDRVLAEQDLSYADIAAEPQRLQRIAGIDYVLVGVVAKLE